MSKYVIDGSTLTDIASAIRSKTGDSELIDPADMADAIDGITGDDRALPSEYQQVEYISTNQAFSKISACAIQYFRRTDDIITTVVKSSDYSSFHNYIGIHRDANASSNNRVGIGFDNNQKRFFSNTSIAYDADDSSISSQNVAVLYNSINNGEIITSSIRLTYNESKNIPSSIDLKISNADFWFLIVGAYVTAQYDGYDQNAFHGNIYSCAVKRADGNKVIDLIPCRTKSNSTPGFFDLIGRVFYPALTGTFTAGPDVT